MSNEALDGLISLIVVGEAAEEDWRTFAALAEGHPAVWRQLAQSQRHQALLSESMREAVGIADRVEIDARAMPALAPGRCGPAGDPRGGESAPTHRPLRLLSSLRWGPLLGWSGWALAAAVVVVAVAAGRRTEPAVPAPDLATDSEALRAYLDLGRRSGRVLGEMPTKFLLDSRPVADGSGYELVYLRGLLERTVVPDLYHLDEGQTDEQGGPALVRWQQPRRGAM
jgi:hypothetical protein